MKLEKGNRRRNLRPYQLEILEQATKKTSPFLCVLPTGGGKTLIGMMYVLLEGISQNKKIVWVAPSKELLDQAIQTLEDVMDIQENRYGDTVNSNECKLEIYCDGNSKPKDYVKYYQYYYKYSKKPFESITIDRENIHIFKLYDEQDKITDLDNDNCDIVFTTYIGLQNNELEISSWMKKDTITIIDEAHHAPAEKLSETLKALTSDGRRPLVGLTATPFRNDKFSLANIFYDPNGLNKIEPLGMIDLIHYGYLSRPIFINDNSCASLEDVVNYYKKEHKKTVIFLRETKYIEQLYEKFKKKDIKAGTFYGNEFKYFSGEQNQDDGKYEDIKMTRDSIVEKFKMGKFDILINSKMLCEGVDIPEINTIFIISTYNSAIQITQIAGRGLRRAEGKQECNIINFTGSELNIYFKDGKAASRNYNDITTQNIDDKFIMGMCIDYKEENKLKENNTFVMSLFDLKNNYSEYRNMNMYEERRIIGYYRLKDDSIIILYKIKNNNGKEYNEYEEVYNHLFLKNNLPDELKENLRIKEIIQRIKDVENIMGNEKNIKNYEPEFISICKNLAKKIVEEKFSRFPSAVERFNQHSLFLWAKKYKDNKFLSDEEQFIVENIEIIKYMAIKELRKYN